MGPDNPYESPARPALQKGQRFRPSVFRLVPAATALIAAGLLSAAVWYGYFTVQNFRYQGSVHPQGSILALSTFIGGSAWMLHAWCLARHRWFWGSAFALVGIACLFWISVLT
ncbi:MAG: hypothetical protein RIK87_09805 [Fuerstiella sp.]